MVNIFGNKDALIGSIDLLIGAVFVLGAFIFRKAIANDAMGQDFSVIGASAGGVLTFVIVNNIIDSIKYAFLIGLVAWLVAGFLLAPLIGDGGTE